MHRQAAIALLAAAVLVPGLQAQMRSGGGAARGAGHAPMAAPARAGIAAGRMPMAAGRRMLPGTGALTPLSQKGFFPHHHHFIFTSGCYYGYCGYPYNNYPYYGYAGYYYPPIFSGFDYGAYDYANYAAAAPATQAAPAAAAYSDPGLAVQIQHLTDEVEQLREEQQARYQPPPSSAPARPSRMDLPTILVFRDGRVTQVKNYGIVGKTLWLLDEQRARKIPLDELDLPATQAANEDRGGFVVPK